MATAEYDLNGALSLLVADLMADEPNALETFEAWCRQHSDDIQLRTYFDMN